MAQIKDGLFGGFSGKIGNVVGCKGKNGFYVRSLPSHVSNPRTELQQAQRRRFSLAMQLARALTPFLHISYREFAGAKKPFHAAVSSFMQNAMVQVEADYAIDFNKVLVSRGSLTAIRRAKAFREKNAIGYTWEDNSGEGNAAATDAALLLAFNKTRWTAVYSDAVAQRCDGKAKLSIPIDWIDDSLVVYLGFRSLNGGTVANSVCLLDY